MWGYSNESPVIKELYKLISQIVLYEFLDVSNVMIIKAKSPWF